MTTRLEKERQKAQQEKFQAILSSLLKDDDNKYCVDCDAKGPRWASWNLGIFLCIRCAGIHRNLGVHISKVKSVNLDTWTPEQIAMMMEVGNSRARAAYEADLPDNYRRPQTDSALESFIRAKYESKKYMAREWVPPKPVVPRELLEDDKDRKKLKNKGSAGNLQLTSVPRSQTGSSSTEPKTTNSKPVESKPVQVKPNPPQQPRALPTASSNTADLIGLDAPVSPVHNNSNSLLGDLNDFMGAPPAQNTPQTSTNQVSNGVSDMNLFGEPAESSDKPGEKVSTKDSIMALYGGQQTQQTQFGVPASYSAENEVVGGLMCTNYITPQYTSSSAPLYTHTDPGYYTAPGVSMYYGGMYMPQQQQQQQQQPQQSGQMYPMQMNNMQQMQMNQQAMYGNQMGMMGMPQGNMGMPGMGMAQQAPMGMPQQQGMMNPQGHMGMPQQQMQQAQFQQMQQQMTNMSLGQPGQFGGGGGMMSSGIPAGQGWGGQTSGHTLSTNLWQ